MQGSAADLPDGTLDLDSELHRVFTEEGVLLPLCAPRRIRSIVPRRRAEAQLTYAVAFMVEHIEARFPWLFDERSFNSWAYTLQSLQPSLEQGCVSTICCSLTMLRRERWGEHAADCRERKHAQRRRSPSSRGRADAPTPRCRRGQTRRGRLGRAHAPYMPHTALLARRVSRHDPRLPALRKLLWRELVEPFDVSECKSDHRRRTAMFATVSRSTCRECESLSLTPPLTPGGKASQA